MSNVQNYQCPSCGGPLPVSNRFVQTVACSYCQTVSQVTATGLDPTGKTAKLVPLPTRYRLGQSGQYRGEGFRIVGRVRYESEGSQWDEWYLLFDDGRPFWLVEDEGVTTLSRVQKLTSPIPPFEEIRVGQTLPVSGSSFFVSEKCRARIAGAEGEIFFDASPGQEVRFADGNVDGATAFLEWGADSIEFGTGVVVERDEIKLVADEA